MKLQSVKRHDWERNDEEEIVRGGIVAREGFARVHVSQPRGMGEVASR